MNPLVPKQAFVAKVVPSGLKIEPCNPAQLKVPFVVRNDMRLAFIPLNVNWYFWPGVVVVRGPTLGAPG